MNVISCGSSILLNSYPLHSHNCWELVYQLRGETKTTMGERCVIVTEGDVFLIPPGVPHSGVSRGGFRDFAIKILDTEFHDFVLVKDVNGDVLTLLNIIQRVLTERSEGFGVIADGLFDTVCAIVNAAMDAPKESCAVRKLKDTLYNNISNSEFRLSDAVAKTGFDKDYFRRTFKRETGKTPLEYLTDLRITRAKQLLERQADITVTAVAQCVGFEDSLYFSACFKKKVGISPTEYRRRTKV